MMDEWMERKRSWLESGVEKVRQSSESSFHAIGNFQKLGMVRVTYHGKKFT